MTHDQQAESIIADLRGLLTRIENLPADCRPALASYSVALFDAQNALAAMQTGRREAQMAAHRHHHHEHA